MPTRECPLILVVDDLADNRGLAVQLLQDHYEVIEAVNGREALDLIASRRPDLVLLDLMMPVMDGFGVLEALAAAVKPEYLPVIVMSAATERESRLRALRLGAHEFVAKPIDREELLLRVATLLSLKASRDEIERHASVLDLEVRARTQDLETALAALRRSDAYKDEFLSVLSHELRTPLNFIMGFASVLEDEISGPLNDVQKHQMGKILLGADRMLTMVDDLLDIARIQAGKVAVCPMATDYAALIFSVTESLAVSAAAKGVKIDATLDVPSAVMVDETRVAQVLTNVIANAVKFSEAGGQVRVTSFVEAGELRTEVSDDGPGLAVEDIPRVFEKFQQVDMSATRAAGGSGLGLAISKALVEAHGGRIGVDSVLGQGATFWFVLPLVPAGEAASGTCCPVEVTGGATGPRNPSAD